MKKKILTLTLSLALVLSLSACGGAPVSGPVDRDPVSNVAESSGKDASSDAESSVDDASSEESVSDTQEASNALTEWYNGSDRTTLEDQINGMGLSGMTFFIEVEEPDTIIYNYQYDEALDLGDAGNDTLQEYFHTLLDSQYQAFLSDIQTYQNSFKLPVTTVRVQYLDNDGTLLYSNDYTEDYVPENNDSSALGNLSGSYASLDEWMASEEHELIVSLVNEQLGSLGMTMDIYADGNVLVMDYTYTEQQDLEGYSQEEINAVFDEQVAPSFSSMVTNMFDSFESDYGLVLDDIRLVFRNADDTQLYSCNYSDL